MFKNSLRRVKGLKRRLSAQTHRSSGSHCLLLVARTKSRKKCSNLHDGLVVAFCFRTKHPTKSSLSPGGHIFIFRKAKPSLRRDFILIQISDRKSVDDFLSQCFSQWKNISTREGPETTTFGVCLPVDHSSLPIIDAPVEGPNFLPKSRRKIAQK